LARSGRENQSRLVRRIGLALDRAAPVGARDAASAEQGYALGKRRLHDLANPGV
jgi:hypothetical protein